MVFIFIFAVLLQQKLLRVLCVIWLILGTILKPFALFFYHVIFSHLALKSEDFTDLGCSMHDHSGCFAKPKFHYFYLAGEKVADTFSAEKK